MKTIWLDVARLVERACVGSLTGIDRVELAYAETLNAIAPDRIRFVMFVRWAARFAVLPNEVVRAFLRDLRHAWSEGRAADCRGAALGLMARTAFACGAPVDPSAVYLLVSHRHLHRQAALARALRRSQALFVPLIHDLIPLEFPEYGRPGEADRHRLRIATVGQLADAVVVNSVATGIALSGYMPTDRRVHVAPLAVMPVRANASVPRSNTCHDAAFSTATIQCGGPDNPNHDDGTLAWTSTRTTNRRVSSEPYFVCVGTIEPRKNHLLLLHIWRRLVALYGDSAPRLVIVGKRGWENENVLDLLDRCPALAAFVRELGIVPDSQLTALLEGARALLMPSFAEGFGLPVAEALAHGTPVLCSDLSALREAGGEVPEYLDPLDAPAWCQAVLDYAEVDSPRREAQLARLPLWTPTSWEAHVSSVLEFIETVPARQPAKRPVRHAVWIGDLAVER